jgi:mono/diheme cytochrome c family protein
MTSRILCSVAILFAIAAFGVNAQDKGPDKAGPDKAGGSGQSGAALYKVVDGTKVDGQTFEGFRAWRAAACDRCHGANQEGLVGPSLLESMKTLSKDEFVKVVRDGRLEKGMQSFGNSKIVMENIDHLYAYLKGRSDGAITQAKVSKIDG